MRDFFTSKKAISMLAGLIVSLVGLLGLKLPVEEVGTIVAAIVAYIVGQGIADVGKERAKVEVDGRAQMRLLRAKLTKQSLENEERRLEIEDLKEERKLRRAERRKVAVIEENAAFRVKKGWSDEDIKRIARAVADLNEPLSSKPGVTRAADKVPSQS